MPPPTIDLNTVAIVCGVVGMIAGLVSGPLGLLVAVRVNETRLTRAERDILKLAEDHAKNDTVAQERLNEISERLSRIEGMLKGQTGR